MTWLLLMTAIAAADEGAVRIAVQDLSAEGVDPRTTLVVAESLVEELRKLKRVSVISMDEVRTLLDAEAQKQFLGCDEDSSCLAEIADAIGADVLIIGTIARVGDGTLFGLRRVEQKQAAVTHTFQRRLTDHNGEGLLASVGDAVAELFPDRPLRDGATRGVAPEVARRLNPPPLAPWIFWTAVASASASAATAALLGAGNGFIVSEHAALVEQGKETLLSYPSVKAQQDLANALALGAWSTLGAAVALGAGAIVLMPFTDFEGLNDE